LDDDDIDDIETRSRAPQARALARARLPPPPPPPLPLLTAKAIATLLHFLILYYPWLGARVAGCPVPVLVDNGHFRFVFCSACVRVVVVVRSL
jgi:hypothetical protein